MQLQAALSAGSQFERDVRFLPAYSTHLFELVPYPLGQGRNSSHSTFIVAYLRPFAPNMGRGMPQCSYRMSKKSAKAVPPALPCCLCAAPFYLGRKAGQGMGELAFE